MIRVVNFLGAILFAGTMFKDGLQIFAVYFAMYYYLWLYGQQAYRGYLDSFLRLTNLIFRYGLWCATPQMWHVHYL